DLPLLVRRLEGEAGGMRARGNELNAMIADVGDPARVMQAEDQRAKLRSELEAKRDQASQRLATTVAALENIRLDLLRLKAGVGTVDQLTADLAVARDVHREIEFAVEARQEVEAALRSGPRSSPGGRRRRRAPRPPPVDPAARPCG